MCRRNSTVSSSFFLLALAMFLLYISLVITSKWTSSLAIIEAALGSLFYRASSPNDLPALKLTICLFLGVSFKISIWAFNLKMMSASSYLIWALWVLAALFNSLASINLKAFILFYSRLPWFLSYLIWRLVSLYSLTGICTPTSPCRMR